MTYDDEDPTNLMFKQIIDRLFWWYAEQEFPTDRFDDISPIPGQIKVKTMSPLCHTSVSKWTLTAGADVKSAEKIERCAKVAGEVVYTVTTALNEYFAGNWTPPKWMPSEQIQHCTMCHSPDTFGQTLEGMNNQQGHMECLMCHADHTKAGIDIRPQVGLLNSDGSQILRKANIDRIGEIERWDLNSIAVEIDTGGADAAQSVGDAVLWDVEHEDEPAVGGHGIDGWWQEVHPSERIGRHRSPRDDLPFRRFRHIARGQRAQH